MNNVCAGALCALLLALASPTSAQDGDGAKITAAMRAGMQSGRCVPPQSMRGGKLRYDLVFAAMGGHLLLCAMHDQHTRGYELAGCWQSGTAAKPFTPHPTRLVPGYSVSDDACKRWGYCRSGAKPDDETQRDLVALSSDATRVAVIDRPHRRVRLFDAVSKKPINDFAYFGEGLKGEGPGNFPAQAYFLGGSVLIYSMDAGPHAIVSRFLMDGTGLGPIPLKGGESFNVYEGMLRVASASVLVARDNRITEAAFNVNTGKADVRHVPRPAACTSTQWTAAADALADDATGEADAQKTAGATCLRAAREARRAFRKPVAYEYQGLRHEIADSGPGGSRRSVITRDAKSGAVVQTRVLPVCAVPSE